MAGQHHLPLDMDIAHVEDDTKAKFGELDGHQRRIPATVVRFPFYDPKKERVRA